MQYQYGNYKHDVGLVSLDSVARVKQYSPRGRPATVRITHNCTGELQAAGSTDTARQANLSSQIIEIKKAYSRDGMNCGLLHNNGSRTPHYLTSSQSITGTRVIQQPSFPKSADGEYVTHRSFTFSIFADFLAPDMDSLYDFQESLVIAGTGGPRNVLIELDRGPPDIQQVSQRTPVYATQSGSAVGIGGYPSFPSLIFGQGDKFVHQSSSKSYLPSKVVGNSRLLFPISWSHKFQSTTPLGGLPNIR